MSAPNLFCNDCDELFTPRHPSYEYLLTGWEWNGIPHCPACDTAARVADPVFRTLMLGLASGA